MKIDDFRHFFVQNPSGKTPGKPPENPRNFGGKFPRFFLGSALETGVPRGEIRGKSGGKSGGNFPEIPKFPKIPGNFGQKRAVFGNFDTLLRSELFFRSCWRAKTEKKKKWKFRRRWEPDPGKLPEISPRKIDVFWRNGTESRKTRFSKTVNNGITSTPPLVSYSI